MYWLFSSYKDLLIWLDLNHRWDKEKKRGRWRRRNEKNRIIVLKNKTNIETIKKIRNKKKVLFFFFFFFFSSLFFYCCFLHLTCFKYYLSVLPLLSTLSLSLSLSVLLLSLHSCQPTDDQRWEKATNNRTKSIRILIKLFEFFIIY